MIGKDHVINKCRFVLKVPANLQEDAGMGFAEQKFKADTIPLLQKTFDAFHGSIRADKIDLHISCELNEMRNDEWKSILQKKLFETLKQIEQDKQEDQDRRKPTDAETLLYFLKNGFLPWWFTASVLKEQSFNAWASLAWKTIVKSNPSLFQSITDSRFAIQRLSNLLSDADIDDWVQITFGEKNKRKSRAMNFEINKKKNENFNTEYSRENLIKVLIGGDINNLVDFIDFSQIEKDLKKTTMLKLTSKGLNKKAGKNRPGIESKNSLGNLVSSLTKQSVNMNQHDSLGLQNDHIEMIEITSAVEEGILIDNAGMVIIANFLPAFFKNLSIVVDNTMQHVDKALLLLQYLCFGNEDFNEQNWLLFKMFCGVPAVYAAANIGPLNENEKQECNSLLESVVANWPALKNTSPDGLRSAFLQRDGKLDIDENAFCCRLLVERKTEDILLDNLAWSYSYVKLPWMKNLLQTNW